MTEVPYWTSVRQVRAESQVPIVLFGYYNPILQRGIERVAAEAAQAGVDGLLVVDLPPEESEELDAALTTWRGLLAALDIRGGDVAAVAPAPAPDERQQPRSSTRPPQPDGLESVPGSIIEPTRSLPTFPEPPGTKKPGD